MRLKKDASCRKESICSVSCGQESKEEELTIPGANTSSDITSKLRSRHKAGKHRLEPSMA